MRTRYTTEQLAEKGIRDIQAMSKDEKAHVRAKLRKALGLQPEPQIYRM